MNETMVTVTGNVAGDVITKRVGANQEHLLVTFRVASSERRYDKASDTWVDGDRFTASVNCWRRLADGARLLVKGDPVVVTGRLSVREYEVEGVRRYMTEISATAVGPDLGRCTATVNPWRSAAVEGTETVPAQPGGTDGGRAADVEMTGGTEGAPGPAGPPVEPAHQLGDGEVGAPTEVEDAAAEGATVTGIAAGERRRTSAGRASA
ncbi:single-stranded DNA-binding protein [Actinomycetospora lutea]|uniref:single-stranded DNA-binding protein n=1 Tax=Actinomycetospora lutea TaxID=663604 RepID=UPI0023658507|nr:single-stranded DNA-binding protein [Actinomycetospora lutea]MDD7942063.1 single-stranded DNA-binding protein [Actinomycetospora lutea]